MVWPNHKAYCNWPGQDQDCKDYYQNPQKVNPVISLKRFKSCGSSFEQEEGSIMTELRANLNTIVNLNNVEGD